MVAKDAVEALTNQMKKNLSELDGPKWEYMVISILNLLDFINRINELGKKRWEVINTNYSTRKNSLRTPFKALLKRQISE